MYICEIKNWFVYLCFSSLNCLYLELWSSKCFDVVKLTKKERGCPSEPIYKRRLDQQKLIYLYQILDQIYKLLSIWLFLYIGREVVRRKCFQNIIRCAHVNMNIKLKYRKIELCGLWFFLSICWFTI